MKSSQLPATERRADTAFRSFQHAVGWYFSQRERMVAPRSANSVSVEELVLGTRVDGGVGSTRDAQLCLLADVARCLPEQNTAPTWVVFVVAVCDGGDVPACVSAIRRHCGQDMAQRDVFRLLALTVCESMGRMRARGLIP